MSRPLRLDLPGALYHVTARGNAREAIYRDDHDRTTFLALLGEARARYGWTCYAYCLMTNHYHLLLALREVPAGRLVRGVQHLNSRSAYRFNQRHRRVGHVYQGRYKAILVQRERHLLELTRYVVLNPVRAGMVDHAATVPFGSGETGRHAYASFVAAGVGEPSSRSRAPGQIYLGDQSFIASAQRQAVTRATDIEVPLAHRGVPANPMTGVVLTRQQRDAAIADAYFTSGETIKALGLRFGLHYSQISRIFKRADYGERRSARHSMTTNEEVEQNGPAALTAGPFGLQRRRLRTDRLHHARSDFIARIGLIASCTSSALASGRAKRVAYPGIRDRASHPKAAVRCKHQGVPRQSWHHTPLLLPIPRLDTPRSATAQGPQQPVGGQRPSSYRNPAALG